jgi:hypothetical protein
MNRTSIRVIIFVALLFGCGSALAQRKRVELMDGSIGFSFVLPAGLSAMSKEAIASVYDPNSATTPKFAFSDQHQDVFVSVGDFGSNATPVELPEIKKAMEAHAEKTYQHLDWLERGWVTINGKKWFRLKFRVAGGTRDIFNDYYVTDWVGRYVLFNFSSSAAQYEARRIDLEKSAKTILLSMVVRSKRD